MPVSVLSWNAVGTVGWQALARDPAQRQHQVTRKTMEFHLLCQESAETVRHGRDQAERSGDQKQL